MKRAILRKGKWYILTAILGAIVMAVSVSFCVWDTTSVKDMFINGKSADYNNAPLWGKKAVGDTLVDANNLEWLIVDKKTANDVVDMVLMTKYVLDTPMAYEPTNKSPDYNSPLNKIRPYLNDVWYPTIDAEIKKYVVPKLTAYLPHTVFPAWAGRPAINTLHPATYSNAWLPGENEVGLNVERWCSAGEYIHDSKFEYFPQNHVNVDSNGQVVYLGANSQRKATTSKGVAVNWTTRTGKVSFTVTTVDVNGGAAVGGVSPELIDRVNYLRPCVQVRFNA